MGLNEMDMFQAAVVVVTEGFTDQNDGTFFFHLNGVSCSQILLVAWMYAFLSLHVCICVMFHRSCDWPISRPSIPIKCLESRLINFRKWKALTLWRRNYYYFFNFSTSYI